MVLSRGLERSHVHLLLCVVVGVEIARFLASAFAALTAPASKASSQACSDAGCSAS